MITMTRSGRRRRRGGGGVIVAPLPRRRPLEKVSRSIVVQVVLMSVALLSVITNAAAEAAVVTAAEEEGLVDLPMLSLTDTNNNHDDATKKKKTKKKEVVATTTTTAARKVSIASFPDGSTTTLEEDFRDTADTATVTAVTSQEASPSSSSSLSNDEDVVQVFTKIPHWIVQIHEWRHRLFLRVVEPAVVKLVGPYDVQLDVLHSSRPYPLTQSYRYSDDPATSAVDQRRRRLGFLPAYVEDVNYYRETSMSIASFSMLFIMLGLVMLVFLSCFYHNQKTSPLFISPRRHRLPKLVPPPLPVDSFFSWIKVIFFMADEEIINRIGYDALIFLRFHRLALRCVVKMSFFSFLVLLPLNFMGGGHVNANEYKEYVNKIIFTDFMRFTMANVAGGSSRLWVHCFAAYLLTAIVVKELLVEYNAFSHIRHRYLLSREPHLRTVLVTNIPRHLRTANKITTYFKHVYPEAVKSVTICQNVILLEKLVTQRTQILTRIERELLLLCRQEKRKLIGQTFLEQTVSQVASKSVCVNMGICDGPQERLASFYAQLEELNDRVEREQKRRKRVMRRIDRMEAEDGNHDIDYILASPFIHDTVGGGEFSGGGYGRPAPAGAPRNPDGTISRLSSGEEVLSSSYEPPKLDGNGAAADAGGHPSRTGGTAGLASSTRNGTNEVVWDPQLGQYTEKPQTPQAATKNVDGGQHLRNRSPTSSPENVPSEPALVNSLATSQGMMEEGDLPPSYSNLDRKDTFDSAGVGPGGVGGPWGSGEHDDDDSAMGDSKKRRKNRPFLRATHAIRRYSRQALFSKSKKRLLDLSGGEGSTGAGGAAGGRGGAGGGNDRDSSGGRHRSGHIEDHTNEVCDKAFVVMRTFTASTIAMQSMHSSKPGSMTVATAPEPRDILWENIYMSKGAQRTRAFIGDVLVIFIIVFYVVPVALVSLLVSESALISFSPRLAQLDRASAFFSSAIGMVQPICLVGIQQLMPPFLVQLGKAEGILAFSEVQMKTFSRYFSFQVLNMFLVTAIAGSVFDTLAIVLENPEAAFEMLGNSLPRMSSFFVTYVTMKAFFGLGVELVRSVALIQGTLRFVLFPNSTLRQQRMVRIGCRAIDDPGWFPFHKILAQDMLVVVISVVFAVVAPLVLIPAGMFYLCSRILWTHHHLFVFESVFETGGQFWPKIFRRFVFGLIIAQATITGQFLLKEAQQEAIATIILMCLTYSFLRSTRARYDATSSALPLEVATIMDISISQEEAEAKRRMREMAGSQQHHDAPGSRLHPAGSMDGDVRDPAFVEGGIGTNIGQFDPFEHAYVQPVLRASARARPEQPFPPSQLGREEVFTGQRFAPKRGRSNHIPGEEWGLGQSATVKLKSLNKQDRELVDRWWSDQLQRAGQQRLFRVLIGEESGTLLIGKRANLVTHELC